MFRRSARKKRAPKHDHDYVTHNVGADLQRQVCSICGQISISASPPAGLRATSNESGPQTAEPPLTVVIDEESIEPVGLSWQFADRRSRR